MPAIIRMNSAEASLRKLVSHVFDTQGPLSPLTYQELAFRIGRINKHGKGHANGMGQVLEKMGNLLRGVSDEWNDPIPHIQALVVAGYGKEKGLPSDGIKEFWPNYPDLSTEEKRHRSRREYLAIQAYGSRWNRVLEALDLEPIERAEQGRRFGGGESPQHEALKQYVAAHPEIVGASVVDEVFTEYVLPSLDKIDVLFKGANRWIAVEVKSSVSQRVADDYERGVYQCIKYRAILEAMRKHAPTRQPDLPRSVLVLELTSPQEIRTLAAKLDVPVIDEIRPH